MQALPKKPVPGEDWHPADIIAEVRKAGWTLRQLSLQSGYSENVCRTAFDRHWPAAERLIAEAIGVQPCDIWPSRYQDSVPQSRRGRKSRTRPSLELHKERASNGG